MKQEIEIRRMVPEDYEQVYKLWQGIHGFGIRSMDDAREGVLRFIQRNPSTSMAAVCGGAIVGAILCGHDGRRACFYHVCVKETHRKQGIGKRMVDACIIALKKENINKVNLIAFQSNEVGNRFWKSLGWSCRSDVNYYECVLNEKNVTVFNP